jgi:fructose-specific component phosphotransferase system IIB-like protein
MAGKSVYLGIFSIKDLESGLLEEKIAKAKEETGLLFIKSDYIKRGKEIIGKRVWICDYEAADLKF